MPSDSRTSTEYDRLLADVRSGLEELIARSASLPRLETTIISYIQIGTTVTGDIRGLATFYPKSSSTREALENTAARVDDAIEAFENYVMTRDERDDADHAIGRTKVGSFLRTELRKVERETSLIRPRGTQALGVGRRRSVTLPVNKSDRTA